MCLGSVWTRRGWVGLACSWWWRRRCGSRSHTHSNQPHFWRGTAQMIRDLVCLKFRKIKLTHICKQLYAVWIYCKRSLWFLWLVLLWVLNAAWVPKVRSQNGQLYVNVSGKCFDSTWIRRLVLSLRVWEHKVQRYTPGPGLLTYCSNDSSPFIPKI